MRKAIAIVAYDRDHYFEIVVPSILAQKVDGRPVHETYDIFIFQDGLCQTDAKSNASGHARLTQHARAFLPSQNILSQSDNLGVALHFDFIEREMFENRGYDFVLFCEDDLVLAPGYAQIIDLMAAKFAGDPRVGMVSANPADVTLSAEKQAARLTEYAPMAHNWGFGLSREFWRKRQPMVDEYLELVRPFGYRERPHDAISAWLDEHGFKAEATSQDFVKQCATMRLGAARVATRFNLGLPIGRSGLHCKPEDFERMGFGRTVVASSMPSNLADLSDATYRAIFDAQTGPMRRDPEGRYVAAPNSKARAMVAEKRAQRLPESDDAEIAEMKSTSHVEDPKAAIKARFPEIEVVPQMELEGVERLVERLAGAECLLEYGAGGSTVLAAQRGVPTIISVESDAAFLQSISAEASRVAPDANLVSHPVDIGPTGEWGRPTDKSGAGRWPTYCSSVWDRINAEDLPQPDLVLIDGRFRVSCLLVSMVFARPGTPILFDDYGNRPHYHGAERHFHPVSLAGRMAEFRVPDHVDPAALLIDLLKYSADCD